MIRVQHFGLEFCWSEGENPGSTISQCIYTKACVLDKSFLAFFILRMVSNKEEMD